jgi:prepilin-type N-terminal cleavage/methylation domain-containing protein
MRKAFSLLELIFVIVLIGIIAGVGSSMFKTNYLLNDTNFIVAKIREAQYQGIGYEHNGFGIEASTPDYDRGCVYLNDVNLSASDYKLHVTLGGDLKDKTLCFDSKGRPHEGDFTKSTLLTEQKMLNLINNSKIVSISIEPVTGYAIIK